MSQYQSQQKIGFLDIVWRFKFQLLAYILFISFVSFVGLYAIGAIPTELQVSDDAPSVPQERVANAQTTTDPSESQTQPQIRADLANFLMPSQGSITTGQGKGELPTQVIIDKIGVNTLINNPSSTDVNTLDNVLLKGAVRYPGSGTLGQGNMFIFGHSSHLKIVNNRAFKAFNDVEKLNIGDTIRVYSATREYTYKVTSVSLVESDKQYIDLKSDKTMLTITTCNVLGEKEERFMVEAVYVNSTLR